MTINGRNVIVKYNNYVIACAKSCELNIDVASIEASSPSMGKYRNFIPGKCGWKVDLSTLVSLPAESQSSNVSIGYSLIGKYVTLSFECIQASSQATFEFTGTAFCSTMKITANLENISQGAFSFQGSGELYNIHSEEVSISGLLNFGELPLISGLYLVKASASDTNYSLLIQHDIFAKIQCIMPCYQNVDYIYSSYTKYKWDGNKFNLIS